MKLVTAMSTAALVLVPAVGFAQEPGNGARNEPGLVDKVIGTKMLMQRAAIGTLPRRAQAIKTTPIGDRSRGPINSGTPGGVQTFARPAPSARRGLSVSVVVLPPRACMRGVRHFIQLRQSVPRLPGFCEASALSSRGSRASWRSGFPSWSRPFPTNGRKQRSRGSIDRGSLSLLWRTAKKRPSGFRPMISCSRALLIQQHEGERAYSRTLWFCRASTFTRH